MCGYFFYLFSAHLQRHQKTCISLSITKLLLLFTSFVRADVKNSAQANLPKLLLPAFLLEEKYGGNYITVRRNCQLFFEY